jgi:16S rRNA processing protein RimM
VGLQTGGAQDLLEIKPTGSARERVLVPFVAALVPEVDVAGGRVVIDPPGGLFDPTADEGA